MKNEQQLSFIEHNKIYKPYDINKYLEKIVSTDYELKDLLLQGEISNWKIQPNGHIYFTVKDDKSEIRCAMWAGNAKMFSSVISKIADGDEVKVKGDISIYVPRGTYSLTVKSIEFSGASVLWQKFEALKKKLSDKGYFDQEHKKPIPQFPNKIGIITASTGAAIRDINIQ